MRTHRKSHDVALKTLQHKIHKQYNLQMHCYCVTLLLFILCLKLILHDVAFNSCHLQNRFVALLFVIYKNP